MPEITRIQCLCPFSRGFILGGDNGVILAFEKTEDPRTPYRLCSKKIEIKLDNGNNTL